MYVKSCTENVVIKRFVLPVFFFLEQQTDNGEEKKSENKQLFKRIENIDLGRNEKRRKYTVYYTIQGSVPDPKKLKEYE